MRGKQTVRGMFQSMAVICAAAAVIYMFVPHDENVDPIQPVDYSVELVTAQRAAPYPVVAPEGLPEDWRATSVSYRRTADNAWHLGYLTPEREYVAVEQATAAEAEKYIARVTRGASATDGRERIADREWERWEGEKYDALVLRDEKATTVVMGTASFERLTEMAKALRPGAAL
ncbi:DUF4245 domain-containing protein [Streptomyces sp. MUM 203J]|uniref:DUF4245 domain-containing protein n=1 Tax=Streptomyces sp. MUM 203J TaxID=2791990 RepID=UPI001F03837D|nr:DUF4245 domain-containing protein [Streptomyces sp. MUM 203J]MCH0540139.1 DUF4245 domain-containing protein [Streptomyces sp. MUM 203J]